MTRLEQAIRDVVAVLFPSLDYLALYPATVKAQNGDGTLELVVTDARLPPFSKVPIRLGIPGATAKVARDSRVLLGFEGASPTAPIATLWDTASVTELVLNGTVIKLNGGGTPVAKEGSMTAGHIHVVTGTAGPFPVTGTATTAFDSIAIGEGSPTVKVP